MSCFIGGSSTRRGPLARARRQLRRLGASVAAATTVLVGRAQAAWAQYNPNAGDGPGGPQLQQLVNWGAGLILIACVGFIALHAGRWGWGTRRHNMAMVEDGKEGVARGAMVAGIVAAAAGLVSFATGLGGQIR